MGNRRLGRKRLYQVESAGKKIDLESGAGIAGAIVSASQHRQGQELITEIAIDLGATGILAGGGNHKAMGTTGAAAHITKLTIAKFGIITKIRAICVEAPTGGITDVDIRTDAAARSQAGTAADTDALDSVNVLGEDSSKAYTNYTTLGQNGSSQHYLYICNAGAGGADMDTGKYLIYIHGYAVPADL